jgi:hypothetical protein
MRRIVCAFVLGAAALASVPAAAAERMKTQRVSAASADRYASGASYRGPTVGHGYSAQARRIADCLATHRNYDPRIDRIRVAPGVTRRCGL